MSLLDMRTYFHEQVLCQKPERTAVELPSQFQIGDPVEIVLGDSSNDVIKGVFVYAVRFAGNGTVAYDLAVPTGTPGLYAVANRVRGSMRPAGSSSTAEELQLVQIEEILPAIKRSTFKVIAGGLPPEGTNDKE